MILQKLSQIEQTDIMFQMVREKNDMLFAGAMQTRKRKREGCEQNGCRPHSIGLTVPNDNVDN
jgi:hypothetical protein